MNCLTWPSCCVPFQFSPTFQLTRSRRCSWISFSQTLILDLSSPQRHSVNYGIPKPPFTVQYMSVSTCHAFIEGIMALGRGTLMAKFDVASAYRNMAIHPDDPPILGVMRRGRYFVDTVLTFWLRHLLSPPTWIWLKGSWFTITVSSSSVAI